MKALDLRGLVPAPVTPFTRDGDVDHAAIQRLGSWLGSFEGGERPGRSRPRWGRHVHHRQTSRPRSSNASSNRSTDRIPVIAGITLEGTKVAALEAKRAVKAGAEAGLVYPSHGWLRFGYQKGAPQDRYRAIYEESGLPLILFQYPGRDQGDVQPRNPARDCGATGCVRDEERRAQHAPVGHRNSGDPSRASQSADSHLPRRISAAHDVRRGRRAGGLRRHCARAADRAHRRRQGQGLRQGTRDPRPAASGDAQRVSPRVAHGRNAWRSSRASSPAASWSTRRFGLRCCRSSKAPTSRSRTRCGRPVSCAAGAKPRERPRGD